ncbi:YdcH family protein [Xanthomonas sp. XNM01]|nr:YdcH family protein [Xanthomonas sp. XNM01]
MLGRVETQTDIAGQLTVLVREHRDLDTEIARCAANAEDELVIKRMKRRKLWLKDCITRLQSQLIPDEPA